MARIEDSSRQKFEDLAAPPTGVGIDINDAHIDLSVDGNPDPVSMLSGVVTELRFIRMRFHASMKGLDQQSFHNLYFSNEARARSLNSLTQEIESITKKHALPDGNIGHSAYQRRRHALIEEAIEVITPSLASRQLYPSIAPLSVLGEIFEHAATASEQIGKRRADAHSAGSLEGRNSDSAYGAGRYGPTDIISPFNDAAFFRDLKKHLEILLQPPRSA